MADQATLRILDANANRAREALRVAEEYARFALNSARLSEGLKGLRHRLRACIEGFGVPAEVLLGARDTDGDVGTVVTAEPEMRRDDAADVAHAALKRLSEALRCLEEYGKILDADAAQGVEAIRYAAYELELQMFRLPRHGVAEARLYVLLDPEVAWGDDLVGIGHAALTGGADVLQLRAKTVSDRELLRWARGLREATRQYDALLVINDRVDIALLADADGVHLGADDLPVRDARRLLGPEKTVGGTANTVDLAQQVEADGADYVGCGAAFGSSTKPDREVVGPERVARLSKAVTIPVFAIGGITLERLDALLKAGCDRVAVCAGVVASNDVEASARAFAERLRGCPSA